MDDQIRYLDKMHIRFNYVHDYCCYKFIL